MLGWFTMPDRPPDEFEREDVIPLWKRFLPFLLIMPLVWWLALHNYYNMRKLVLEGREADGKIIDKLPKQHMNVRYSFDVHGRTFTAQGRPPYSSKEEYDAIHLGDHFTVTYWPKNPSLSCLCDPEEEARESLGGAFGGTILYLSAMWGVWYYYRDKARKLAKRRIV